MMLCTCPLRSAKKMRIPKIHHLIRYVIVLGIITFVAYLKQWQSKWLLLMLGPAIYLSSLVKDLLSKLVTIPSTSNAHYFGFLLPITIVYFSVMGFLFKQLWNERGMIRF